MFSANSFQANLFQPIFGGILILFFLILSLQLAATPRAQFYPDISVYSEINDYEYYRVNSYFIQTAYLFNRMYGLEFSEYNLEVVIDDKALSNVIKNGKTPATIVVVTNQKLLFTDTRSFEKNLIRALLLAEIYIPIDKYENSDIKWIITGSLREVNRRRDPSLTYSDFPIVTRIVQHKGKVDYQKIITLENIAEDGALYACFAEESQILIDAILKEKRGKEFIFEYVKVLQSSDKYDKLKLFEELLKKHHSDFDLPEEEVSASFNEYLNKTAAELAINTKNPLPPDSAVEKYLCETERKKNNIGRKYYFHLRELEMQNEPIDRAWPELQKFLNENYPNGIK